MDALSLIPYVGDLIDIIGGARDGDWVRMSIGVVGLGMNVVAPGTGTAVRLGAKGATALARGGTYMLRDPITHQVVRTGRTKDLARRQREHDRNPETRPFEFVVAHRTDIKAEQRGLEQMLHDHFKPPMNKINPVSARNPRKQGYLEAAERFLRSGENP